ncbi:MAG TPA: TAXI family TRAP transporter solute-binding subunit [Clostridia bacterium]|nr:TAXI family TRAP transporter solute-binding subunit [Clostridia bacterium]
MKLKKIGLIVLTLVMAASVFTGCGAKESGEEAVAPEKEVVRISLATGGTGGTYYPVGSGIASLLTKNVEGLEVTAESTGASVANLKMIKDGQVEMILAAANTSLGGYTGAEPFEVPIDNIRGITALYPETFQFVVLDKSGLTSIEELKGKRVAVGAPGSGTERTAKMVLDAHGITYDDIDAQFLGFGEAITALKDRLIDCAIVGSGIPTSSVVDASATLDINLLTVNKEATDKLMGDAIYFRYETIPEGTYNGVDHDTLTVATPALMVASKDLDEELVYEMTKAIYENIEDLEAVHAQGKNIKLENATSAMSIPLHPGAERYYKEMGVIE